MPRLNQVIAIEANIKSNMDRNLTDAYHALQKPPLMGGIARSYRPKDDDGEQLPSESTKIQARVDEILRNAAAIVTKRMDATATKDAGNQTARADLKIDGKVLLRDVPALTLLYLEDQLTDLATVFRKLPALDPSESWGYDTAQNCWATAPIESTRTKKIPRNHVLAHATDKHPAQVQVFNEDVVVGYWRTVKFSGALEQRRIDALQERVTKLLHAVKEAIAEANVVEVPSVHIGETIFDYILGEA